MEKKKYSAPVIKREKIKIGVFGQYNEPTAGGSAKSPSWRRRHYKRSWR